jgi:competence ComEA-like helix-hairpin-helix protein
VEYRSVNGPFLAIEDLQKVPGIGGSKLEKFRQKIRI